MIAETVTARTLLEWLLARRRHSAVPTIAIDGPGGAGKTTLSEALVAVDPELGLVHVDDFHHRRTERLDSGDVGAEFDLARLRREVLELLARGEAARYRRYDWNDDSLAEEHVVEPRRLILLEGVYSSVEIFDGLLACRLWVECPAELRLSRGLE